MSKPITLYSHKGGPSPWKVAILLEELSIPFEPKYLDMQTEVKAKPFIDINPNGRYVQARAPFLLESQVADLLASQYPRY